MSIVSICNIALARIGHTDKIASLSEASHAAQNCTLLYENARDSVMAEPVWSFARRAVALAVVNNAEFPGWTYVYRYPTDCLVAKMIVPAAGLRMGWVATWQGLQPSLTALPKIPYQVAGDPAGRTILCDLSEAYLIYTARVEDPTLWSQGFRDALAWRMASELVMPLSKDPRRRGDADRGYALALDMARRVALNEMQQDPEPESVSITGRW